MPKKSFRVFHLIQQAHSALFRAADRRIKENAGLSSSQHAVLSILLHADGASISSIAKTLSMKKNSLSELIDRMATKQLVTKKNSPEDGRVSLVYIEPEGKVLVEKSQFFVKFYNEKILEPFSETEQATIDLISNSEEIIMQQTTNKDREANSK